MFKRMWRKLNRIVSAPILCYLILILLSFVLVGVPLLFSDSNVFGNIITNFGYGIFGSTFVSVLIDYGATIRQRNNDQKEFFLLTKDLKEAINNLVSFRNEYNHVLAEKYREIAYDKWIYKIAAIRFESDGHNSSLLVVIKTYFQIILEMAEMLDNKSSILVNNLCLPDDFIYNLGQLILYTKMALGNEKNNDDISFRLGTTFMLAIIPLLFPEYKSILFEKWNDSEKQKINECKN